MIGAVPAIPWGRGAWRIEVPLTLLGNDDGVMDFGAVAGEQALGMPGAHVMGVACAAGTALTRSPPPRNGCRIRVETDKLPLGKPREHVLLAHRTHNGRHQRQRPRQPQNRPGHP